MSLSAQNSDKNQKNSARLSHDQPSVTDGAHSEITVGPFNYGLSHTGLDIFAPESALALLLLEPVRNLRWSSGDSGEITSTCVAGTVFVVPAHKGLVIIWPDTIELLKITILTDQISADKQTAYAGRIDELADSVVNFSSKQCLQVGRLIIEALQDSHSFNDSYLRSLYEVMLHLLVRSAVVARGMSGVNTGLSSYACRQVENFLKDKFRESVSVPDMAAMLGISAGHFATCFRESFGQTPHQYLMALRLDEAERYLTETDMTISDVAARLSFSSQSHLTTALRKYRQLTPGEVRRRGLQKRLRKS